MIPESIRLELERRITEAVTKREAAVDVMQELQCYYGWLTDEAVQETAELLGLSPLQVDELATFYEMIFRRSVGNHVIHVCDSISCWSVGGDSLLKHFERLLGIVVGETTDDGNFTLLPCSCLGNCGNAPSVMIGNTLFGSVNLERAKSLIAELRSGVQ